MSGKRILNVTVSHDKRAIREIEAERQKKSPRLEGHEVNYNYNILSLYKFHTSSILILIYMVVCFKL